ncbi:hypothetical protein [Flavobacterium capsici]|uniref:Uncharacterized protein n=1 Tax=Flavobacterium capsici TaxID=3075618 RepID=A0AA96EWA4_9FLAO|nr:MULTISPECIES: hypothetical protein [unclassified Flavobacterium]WNM18308.1 hypothetical protein RN608_09810 [Flavobacterium sp. PMR2A8]WNM22359.1 hypothetical protein RN605_03110 [Flavobacterium sp. PMTSA4]
MSSTSERTFGSRLQNAKTLKTYIVGFDNYQPESGENSPEDLQETITIIETLNPQVETSVYNYRQEVAERRIIFSIAPTSIKKIATPINAYYRGKFGKNSSQYLAISALVAKIRGTKLVRTSKTDQETHSTAQLSYGSILQNFKNIITDIEALGADYTPANNDIKLEKLIDIKSLAETRNEKVSQAFAIMSPKQDQRQDVYDILSSKSLHIKDLVQSQYGFDSSEYNLVKGLNI